MRKKILIGSMLVFAILLLMPSIPAIQLKTIDDGLDARESELLTRLRDFDTEKIKDLLNKKSLDDRPLFLTLFIYAIFLSRLIRSLILWEISTFAMGHDYKVIFPILFLRYYWLGITLNIWTGFWEDIYDERGWDLSFW